MNPERKSALLAALLAVAVVNCTGVTLAAEPHRIDVILPLTGPGAFLGTAEVDALRLAEKVINDGGGVKGVPIAFEYHDDQSTPQTAVQLANQIKASHPSIILGSTLTGTCNAIAPLMREGPFMYCFSPSIHPPAGSYVFAASVSTYDLQRGLLAYLRHRGWKRIAFIAAIDASGQDAERGVEQAMALPENSDMKLVVKSRYNPTDISVAAQLEQVKAASPDVLIAWSTGAAIATIFRGAAQADLNLPVATTNGNMTHAQMREYQAFLPKELYIASSVWPAYRSSTGGIDPAVIAAQKIFFSAFDQAGLKPDLGATNVWDTAFLVTKALREYGVDATAEQIRNYLSNVTDFAGINGVYDFKATPQRGLDARAALVTRWNPGKSIWEVVSQPDGKLVSP